jgi:hypothetical protein
MRSDQGTNELTPAELAAAQQFADRVSADPDYEARALEIAAAATAGTLPPVTPLRR